MLNSIQRLIADPPPERLFEVSEDALASASTKRPEVVQIKRFEERALSPSPSTPNILRSQAYREGLSRLGPEVADKRKTAALVIPDYAVRMAVLDFTEFPEGREERDALIRFRLRKSVPFHIDEAQLGYSVQSVAGNRIDVLAVSIARPILNEYETLLTEAEFRVGMVTPSCLAALPLYGADTGGLTLVAKLAGQTISVLLIQAGKIKLVRCLDALASEQIQEMLDQTVAFAEDQLGARPDRLVLCGFDSDSESVGRTAAQELGLPPRVAQSRYGAVSERNAGVLGLLEQYAA